MNAPDATKDIIAAIDLLKTDIVTAIGSINTSETVSRSIYVDTTGSDVTGDGTIGMPFLTIGKALSTIKLNINVAITITINIGIGTFTLSNNDLSLFTKISGSGTIIMQGVMTLIDSGFAMGVPIALDPLTYNVSGGNTATWTLNQWKNYFLKSGAIYYPITANALTPTISITRDVTGTEIYQSQTIIDFSAVFSATYLLNFNLLNITFLQCQLTIPNFVGNFTFRVLNFDMCTINSSNNMILKNDFESQIKRTICNGITLALRSFLSSLDANYFSVNKNGRCVSLTQPANITNFVTNVFENPNTGALAGGLSFVNGIVGNGAGALNYLKFVNSNVGIVHIGNNNSLDLTVTNFFRIILVTTNYLMRKSGGASDSDYATMKFKFPLSQILGTPVVRWFYDNMIEFVNITTGRNYFISGLIYPENEQNLTAVLTNNATTQIIVGNKLQNETISIDYEVKRAGYRKGSFDIINNGAALTMSTDTFITDGTADVSGANVVFTVNYNTNEIRIAVQLSNAVAGTLKYNVRRTMITPLTI